MRRPGSGLGLVLPLVLALAGCGGSDGSGPSVSLVGTWDFIGFSDAGVEATTTGTVVFGADGTVTWDGTVTFPGEPTDAISVTGIYQQTGSTLVLTFGAEPSTTWTIAASGDEVLLTAVEAPPANTIRLRRA